jgi:hypothetical protein
VKVLKGMTELSSVASEGSRWIQLPSQREEEFLIAQLQRSEYPLIMKTLQRAEKHSQQHTQ